MDGPFRRSLTRIGHEWQFTHHWQASADTWSGGRNGDTIDYRRAARDMFYEDIDEQLDSLDGHADPEYWDDEGGTERTTGILAGFIRSLYLHEPGYRGPIVHDERPE
jgi:hypothetical protein